MQTPRPVGVQSARATEGLRRRKNETPKKVKKPFKYFLDLGKKIDIGAAKAGFDITGLIVLGKAWVCQQIRCWIFDVGYWI